MRNSYVRSSTLSLVAGVCLALAGESTATKYAGAFMADGGGARALGMGSAFVAVANDASASFWNPAGLLQLQERQVLLMHSERFGDLIDRDFASYAHPLGDGESAFAVSVIRLGLDDIAFTSHLADELDVNGDGIVDDDEATALLTPGIQDQIRYESDQEWAFFGSYARAFGEWGVGANLKFIRQSIAQYSSFGLGIDVGVLRRGIWRDLDVGMKFQDATFTYLGWDNGTNESIAPVAIPGAAYRFAFDSLNLGLTAASALELRFEDRGDADQFEIGGPITGNLNLGLEATLAQLAQLRAGSHGGFDWSEMTFGVGLLLGALHVDYGFAGDVLDIDENTHRVSLGYDF